MEPSVHFRHKVTVWQNSAEPVRMSAASLWTGRLQRVYLSDRRNPQSHTAFIHVQSTLTSLPKRGDLIPMSITWIAYNLASVAWINGCKWVHKHMMVAKNIQCHNGTGCHWILRPSFCPQVSQLWSQRSRWPVVQRAFVVSLVRRGRGCSVHPRKTTAGDERWLGSRFFV